MTDLPALVRGLRDSAGSPAAALLNRDGGVIAAALPSSVSQETFSIMCAAILGAGMTAFTELGRAAPHRIVLESADSKIVIQEVGQRAMIVLVVAAERSVSELVPSLDRFAQAAMAAPL